MQRDTSDMNPGDNSTKTVDALVDFDIAGAVRGILADSPVLYDKITAACDIERSDVAAALREVLRFLSLIARYNLRLTPSRRVDLAWHEFILCTRLYADFCRQHFGRFIHHHPGGDREDNHDQFRQTIKLYNLRYGKADARFWGIADVRGVEADCGACDAD